MLKIISYFLLENFNLENICLYKTYCICYKNRFEPVTKNVVSIEDEIKQLKIKIDNLKESNESLRSQNTKQSNTIEALKASVVVVENSLSEYQTKIYPQFENRSDQLTKTIQENQNLIKVDINNRCDDLTKAIDITQNNLDINMKNFAVKTECLQKSNTSLEKSISHTNKELSKKIGETEKTIKSDINIRYDKLTKSIDSNKKNFEKCINDLESKTENLQKVNLENKTALKDTVSKLEKSLKADQIKRCDQLSQKITANGKTVKSNLANRCNELKNTINTNQENLESKLKYMNISKVTKSTLLSRFLRFPSKEYNHLGTLYKPRCSGLTF